MFNNYNGEVWRGQIVHNYYVDDNTTVTSRVYAQIIAAIAIKSPRWRTIRPICRSYDIVCLPEPPEFA